MELATWQWGILLVYGTIVLAAAARHVILTFAERQLRFMTPRSPMVVDHFPLVSIMVPAKDEEATIETCLCALLGQDYPNFEILVVDDRSQDATAAVVRRLAAEQPRIRLLQVTELPPGWTGKTHALHLCQQAAKGEWLLFVDADTRLHSSCLSVLLRDALDHRVVLESLLPALEAHSFWEKVIQPFASICFVLLFPIPRVNRPKHRELGFANGQFILIQRAAYDAIGGHEKVRDKFVEDIQLGRNIRQAGLGLRVVLAPALVRVRMYSSLRDIVRGWSRIFYSAVDFRPAKLWLIVLSILLFSVTSYVFLLLFGGVVLLGKACPFAWVMLVMALVHQVLQETLMARLYAHTQSARWTLWFRWLAVGFLLYILFRTIRLCRTHEVTWRGTTYTKAIQSAPPTGNAAP